MKSSHCTLIALISMVLLGVLLGGVDEALMELPEADEVLEAPIKEVLVPELEEGER